MKSKEKDESIELSVGPSESSSESSASSSESSESSEPSSESPMSSEFESSDYEPVESGSSAGINSQKKKQEKRVQKEKAQRAVAQAVGKAAPNSKVSVKPRTKKKMKQQRKKDKRTKKRNPKDTNQLVPVSCNVSTEPVPQLDSNQGKDLIVIKVKKAASGPDAVAYKLLGVTTGAEVKKLVGKKEPKTTAEANKKVLPQVKASKKKKTKGLGDGKGVLKPNAKTSEKLPQASEVNVEKVKASKKRKTKGHGSGKGLLKPKARTSKELPEKSERKFPKEINDKKVSNEEMKDKDSTNEPGEPICHNIKIVKTKTGMYRTKNVESSSTSSSESDVHEESSAPSSTTESDSMSTSTSDTSATSSSSSTLESTTASTSTSSSVSDSEVVLKKLKTVARKKKPDELYESSKSVSSLVRKSGASSTVSSTESEDSYDSSSESSSDEDIPILQMKKTIIRGRKRKARKPVSRRTKRQRRRIGTVKSEKDCITGQQGGKDGQVKAPEIADDADKKPVTQEIEGEVMSSESNVKTLSSKEAPHKTFDKEKKTVSAKRKKKKNRRRRVRRRRRRVSQPKEKISITAYQRKNLDFVYSYALKNGYDESNWKDVAKSIRRIKKVKIEEAIEKKLGRRLSSGLNLVRMKFFNLPRVCLKKSDKRRIEREINKKLKSIRKAEGKNYSQQLVSQKASSYSPSHEKSGSLPSPSYEKSGSLPLTPTVGQNSETNFMLDLSDDKSLSANSSINMADLNEEAQNQVLDKFLTLFGA